MIFLQLKEKIMLIYLNFINDNLIKYKLLFFNKNSSLLESNGNEYIFKLENNKMLSDDKLCKFENIKDVYLQSIKFYNNLKDVKQQSNI